MSRMCFINFPVVDLDRARSFYEAVGFANEPKFTDDTAACMVWSESIFVMLLTHDKWKEFTSKAIPDPRQSAQVMVALSCDSRKAVDAMVEQAAKAGGTPDCNPVQDYSFMYGRSFEDPDGHIWETFWMDPVTAESGPPAEAVA